LEHKKAVHQLSLGFKKTYNSVMREVLYNSVSVLSTWIGEF